MLYKINPAMMDNPAQCQSGRFVVAAVSFNWRKSAPGIWLPLNTLRQKGQYTAYVVDTGQKGIQ